MFKPLAIYIGLRYTRAKRRNHFISFISLASMLGIALGVMVLITVLSVMNGFDQQIKNRIFAMVPQATVTSIDNIANWSNLANKIKSEPHVIATAPFASGQGMLSSSGEVAGVYFTGILPEKESLVSNISGKMVSGTMNSLKEGTFNIVLGVDLARRLQLTLGDQVTLFTPQASVSPLGIMPRFKRFNVVGIFEVGGGFGFDSSAVFMHISDAQKLLQLDDKVSGIRIKVRDLYDAPRLRMELKKILPMQYLISDWTEEYGTLFKAIQMEKTMMFIILMFIIAVAVFNLVSTLVMVVTDKRSDIAILRTLGASPKMVMAIFIVQGLIIGLLGTIMGVISGIILALNATDLVALLEHYLNVHFISSSVYFINYLPSELVLVDVVKIALAALGLSLLATVYPAWQASRTQPAEALRYE